LIEVLVPIRKPLPRYLGMNVVWFSVRVTVEIKMPSITEGGYNWIIIAQNQKSFPLRILPQRAIFKLFKINPLSPRLGI